MSKELIEYAIAEMFAYMESNGLKPEENHCVRASTGDKLIPSTCQATIEFEVGEDDHAESELLVGAEHCTFDWTPSPGGTGGVVWHYDELDGWKFVQVYE